MNILMTGASGFIGTEFLKCFKQKNSNDKLFLLTRKPIEGFVNVDYTNYRFEKKAFDDVGLKKIDVLLLMGAYVETSRNNPHVVEKHLSSVVSLHYLLNNLPCRPKKIVYCSSIAVYGIDSTLPYHSNKEKVLNENTKIDPIRTYALAKVFSEKLVSEWCDNNDVICQVLRIGSCYDTKRSIKSFLGYMIKAYQDNSTFSMSAPPNQLWNFVYIDDICNWLFSSLFQKDEYGVINLTSDKNYTSIELVNLLKRLDSTFMYIIPDDIVYKGVDKGFDSSKRKKIFGNEKYPLELVLKKMVNDKQVVK